MSRAPEEGGHAPIPWTVIIHLWMRSAWKRRYLILVLVLTLPVVGFATGKIRPKLYQTSMTILVQEAAKHNPFLEDLAVETRMKDRIAALEALLHSRHVLLGVAADLGWIEANATPQEQEKVLSHFAGRLTLTLVGDELIKLTYKQDKTEDIEKVLLAIAQRFMEKVLAPERSSIAGSVRFLEDQISESEKVLAAAEQELSAFRTKNAGSLPELHASNVNRLSQMRAALSERRTELEGAKARYDDLIARLSQNNPVVLQIEQQIVKITTDLAALRSRYTAQHSAVRAAQHTLERLQSERNALLGSMSTLNEADIERLWSSALRQAVPESGVQYLLVSQMEALQDAKSRTADLTRQVESLTAEVDDMERIVTAYGDVEKEMNRLKGDVDVKRDVHAKLHQRVEMARVTGALGRFEAPERVKVIDQPSTPTRPMGLPATVYAILGIVAAIGAGIGMVAVEEATNTSIRTREAAQRLGAGPVLTRIPYLGVTVPPQSGSAPWHLRTLINRSRARFREVGLSPSRMPVLNRLLTRKATP